MNEYLLITLIGVLATACMTLFSYVYSAIRKRQYREPVLLSRLLNQIFKLNDESILNRAMGWAAHFGVGILFVFCYHFTRNILDISPTLIHYAIAGAVSGLLGIVIWKLVFVWHKLLHKAHQAEYFFQLEIAHIIFGLASSLLPL